MFDQTFVNGSRKTMNIRSMAGSFLLQGLLVVAVILTPLIYTETLPSAQLRGLFVGPPPPATSAPKPPTTTKPRTVAPHVFSIVKLVAPSAIPRGVKQIEEVAPAPDVGIPGGTGSADGLANPLLAMSSNPPPPPEPPAAAKLKKSTGPMRIGGVVAQANLISQVQPVYPPLAKAARVQGTVEFMAVISKQGRVENLQLMRGHPLLVAAARDAILQWRYRPTLLNGEPVEVATTITVNFTLSP